MQTVSGIGYCEYEVKRSKFIGTVCGVKSKKEALDFINQIKTKYAEATHNVYAYIINDENLKKSSDDGEPKGTAGVPVLNVLCGLNLTDIAIVVTRYFGGILLGAGGLVRAYSTTAKNTLANAKLVDVKNYIEVVIELKYNLYNTVNALLTQFETVVLKTTFFDKIHIEFKIEKELFEKFKVQILNDCNGDITIIKRDDSFDF
ncbi:MAG: YigZ family protein [Oscillospiraceae bacterium]|nr:YigZ family protein [Oscillospiraceae bacterium]